MFEPTLRETRYEITNLRESIAFMTSYDEFGVIMRKEEDRCTNQGVRFLVISACCFNMCNRKCFQDKTVANIQSHDAL